MTLLKQHLVAESIKDLRKEYESIFKELNGIKLGGIK